MFTTLGGRATTMLFDPRFVRSLYSRSITTKASGAATLSPQGTGSRIMLPITSGRVTMYSSAAAARNTGEVRHSGSGLRLGNADGVTVRVDSFVLTLGVEPQITAELATGVDGATGPAKPVQLFTLKRTADLASSVTRGVGTLSGMRLYLTTAAAKALDSALETTAFAGIDGPLYAGTITVSMTRG